MLLNKLITRKKLSTCNNVFLVKNSLTIKKMTSTTTIECVNCAFNCKFRVKLFDNYNDTLEFS